MIRLSSNHPAVRAQLAREGRSAKRSAGSDEHARLEAAARRKHLEDTFAAQLRALELAGKIMPPPVREYQFHESREWKFDFCWPGSKLALEIEGGIGGRSRHTSKEGFAEDCRKYNAATLSGWRVLRFSGSQVLNGEALAIIEQALPS